MPREIDPKKLSSAAAAAAAALGAAAQPDAARPPQLPSTPPGGIRLSALVGALRRELAEAAAATGDEALPGLMIASADFDLSCTITDARDKGVWVALRGAAPAEASAGEAAHRLRLSLLDVDVAAAGLARRRGDDG